MIIEKYDDEKEEINWNFEIPESIGNTQEDSNEINWDFDATTEENGDIEIEAIEIEVEENKKTAGRYLSI